ncbi:MAG TPA: hypothetical protein VFW04_17715 [Gemmatimonadaceae bacterium]|nr:hypothetical protein [Gemmatimonadaceae bacterium]
MVTLLLAVTTLLAGPAPHPAAVLPVTPPKIEVRVDSAHSRIIVTAGPFRLPAMNAQMDMSNMTPNDVMPFTWPVDGYLRGFSVRMRDAAGKALPREILHHLIGVNFDRRQLVYPAVERLFGWGAETDPVELPASMGVPMRLGEKLGMYAMFHNETGKDIDAAYLEVTLLYTPAAGHDVLSVMPFYVDVNNHIGGVTTFDVPPGKSTHSYEFELPIGGKLVGIGGHLHDYGSTLELQDATNGKVLARLKARRDHDGHVQGVGRFIFGFNSDALALKAHHPYRVVAEYDNPTSETFKDGGMGHINGAFVPDDGATWPKLDLNDPLVKRDIATLPIMTDMNEHPAGTASQQHKGAAGHDARASGDAKMRDMPMSDMPNMPAGRPSQPKADSTGSDHTP